MTQVALAFFRLRSHNMGLVRLFPLQKAAAGHFEALFRARLGLHLWHSVLKIECAVTAVLAPWFSL